ncbi:CHAT domain-containing protein [Candidatus Synechococcus calcipolaris G9]|uniref:CHAT domain-containing protein n=1 Tax=Candidatus Synechococcus calcipolaris G9 TaxID=1497997 RepID=A0ABT6EVA8_9SYNE|nr:CHAT domain-containing tetratricopeptide repeat protein [Candidatus Synechococcus calcipolaris]MDG2989698.1 CHAT domain-containing protein [Candidatus Synechococcus calcipolaris G9]
MTDKLDCYCFYANEPLQWGIKDCLKNTTMKFWVQSVLMAPLVMLSVLESVTAEQTSPVVADYSKDNYTYSKDNQTYSGSGVVEQRLQQPQNSPTQTTSLTQEQLNEIKELYEQAQIFHRQGNYEAALPLYQRSLRIVETALGENHLAVAASLNNLANLYFVQGNYEAALPLHQRSLRILEATLGENHPDVATSLNNLAQLYFVQGNYEAALPLYQRSLRIFETALGESHPYVAQSLNNLAELYYRQGNYEAVLPLHQRSLRIREATLGENHPDVAQSLNNLANLYSVQGNYEAALPLHQRSLRILEATLGENHPDVATSLNNLAQLYFVQGNYEAALPLHQRSLRILEATLGENHPDVATSLNNLAQLYYRQGNYEAALPLHQRSLRIREATLGENHPDVASSLNNLAIFHWRTAEFPKALGFFQRAMESEESSLSLNLVIGSEEYKRNYLATFSRSTNRAISFHLQGTPQTMAAAELALTTILRRKGRLLDVLGETNHHLRHQLDGAGQRQLEQLVALRTEIAGLTFAPGTPPPPDQLRQLTQAAEQLEGELSLKSASFRQATTPVTLNAVQAAIPNDAALVEFIHYRPFDIKNNRFLAPRYAVYVLSPRGNPQWQNLGDAAEIDALIKAARQQMVDPRLPSLTVKSASQALDAKVMAPVRRMVGNVSHLLIAPDAQLNLIPFQALVDEQDRYLLESFTITVLTSGRDLLRLQLPLSPASSPLVVANPNFERAATVVATTTTRGSSQQRSGDLRTLAFGELPGTAAEANAIRDLLPSAEVLKGPQATESAVKAVQSPRILHLATHGFFLENTPPTESSDLQSLQNLNEPQAFTAENPLLRSGLALAGFNQRQSGGDDGVLTALEVTAINLDGTELVVLSACDTGRGDLTNGDGVYGLRRAFTLAGARSQVGTLWKVDDQVTKDIMVAYYENLLRGLGRTEAMRQVQLEMLNNPQTETPYYWAAFVSSGDWLPLSP